MDSSLEQTLVEVWRQALVENAKTVELGGERFPVRRTPKRGLRQVDFLFDCCRGDHRKGTGECLISSEFYQPRAFSVTFEGRTGSPSNTR
jgi:hypothetical protein